MANENRPAAQPIDSLDQYLPRELRGCLKDFFCYSVEYNTLTAAVGASNSDSFTVQNDAHFLVLGISHVEATSSAGTTEQTFPHTLVQIRDSGSGANWFDSPQHLANVSGRMAVDGHGVNHLVRPRFVLASSEVTVDTTNLAATARRLWITFHGAKIYKNLRG